MLYQPELIKGNIPIQILCLAKSPEYLTSQFASLLNNLLCYALFVEFDYSKSKTWIQLTDYSTKYEVSISTLRRRIKEESISYRVESGKYYILDEAPSRKQRGRKPAEERKIEIFSQGGAIGSAVYFDQDEMTPVVGSETSALEEDISKKTGEPIFSAANRLLEEIKRAYSQVLLEKEEQILQLKEEIADLRTLAQVLESENERLRQKMST